MLKFNYRNDGDILYGVETFRFRFRGRETADVNLFHLLDIGQYAYHILMTDKNVSSDFKKISSNDLELFEKLGVEYIAYFNEKKEALQNAIDVMSAAMSKSEDLNKGLNQTN